MHQYKFGSEMTEEALDKLRGQAPKQGAGILLAIYDLGGFKSEVPEDKIVTLMESDLARYSPGSAVGKSLKNSVSSYRGMLSGLPEHILTVKSDGAGRGKFSKGRNAAPATILDPLTGEDIPNVFKKKRAKAKEAAAALV